MEDFSNQSLKIGNNGFLEKDLSHMFWLEFDGVNMIELIVLKFITDEKLKVNDILYILFLLKCTFQF